MKKIGLFLESAPNSGGTFQYNQAMLAAVAGLPSDRYSVVVGYTSELWLSYLAGYDLQSVYVPGGFWSRAFGLGWLLLSLPMGLWRKLSPLFHPMAKVLLREKCDLWIFPSQDARSFQIPVPALVSIHDLMHRYERRFPESASWWNHLNRERSYVNICRWAEGVLVDSEIGRQQVVECYGMPAERLHLLPFIAPHYIQHSLTPCDFDQRYQLPGKYLFYPAQFWEHKNHKNLIKAIATVKNKLPDIKLVLAGPKDKTFPEIAAVVHKLGLADAVLFPGYVPDSDMAELYRRARALVMPTYYGPTNIPPLEAFTMGCPVAVSDIFGSRRHYGNAALYFNPDSVEEIADCIMRLWKDDLLCASLVEHGKIWVSRWGQQEFNKRVREVIDSATETASSWISR